MSAPSWADALASGDDAIILLDALGRIAELTPAAEQLLQLSPSHAVGQPIAALLPPDTHNAWLAELCHHTLQDGADRKSVV